MGAIAISAVPAVNWRRVATRVSQGIIVVVAAAATVMALGLLPQYTPAIDQQFYQRLTEHWLSTGQLYLPDQLDGSYRFTNMQEVFYPPLALYLFVPFVWLPIQLWYILPVAGLALALHRLRPAWWAWVFMAGIFMWPFAAAAFIYGNSAIWAVAIATLGVAFAWPSPFILFKPSLWPFALIGMRRRTWWLALALIVLLALPFGGLWIDYLRAIHNSNLSPTYVLRDFPLMCLPLVAWAGRQSGPSKNGGDKRARAETP